MRGLKLLLCSAAPPSLPFAPDLPGLALSPSGSPLLEKLDPSEFCALDSDQVISEVCKDSMRREKTADHQKYSFKSRFKLQFDELCFSEMSGKLIFLPHTLSICG